MIDQDKTYFDCKWHDNFSWACCNGDSPHRADFPDPEKGCGEWEERENA